VRDVVPEHLDERLVRQLHVFVAAPEQHGGTVGVRRARGLGRKPGLADAGLAREQHELALPVLRFCPGGGERRRFRRAAEHRGRRAFRKSRRERNPARRERLPCDRRRLDGVGEAFQRERTDGRERMPAAPAREHTHDVGDEDLAALRFGAEPRRLDEREAMGVLVLPRDVARADPDPDDDRCSLRTPPVPVIACWIATAAATASAAPVNDAMIPSPTCPPWPPRSAARGDGISSALAQRATVGIEQVDPLRVDRERDRLSRGEREHAGEA
jgi:hypothetical protein